MIACLAIPYFAATVERRDDRELQRSPLVIGGQPWEPRPVYAFSQEVAHQGVRPGMSLRLAHVLSPRSRFLPPAPPRYFQATGEVVDVLTDFSPAIEPEGLWRPDIDRGTYAPAVGRTLPARYYIDLASLPVKEALPLTQHIGRTVRDEAELPPAMGLAGHKFIAQVAATFARPNHARVVAPGEEADFLAERSIGFLPLDGETRRRLDLLGVKTLGQLAALPLSALRDQFGPDIELFYRLARGQADTPFHPRALEQMERVHQLFDEPVADNMVIIAVLARLATRLAGRLQKDEQEGRILTLVWETEEGTLWQQSQKLRYPTANVSRLTTVLHEIWGRAEIEAAVVSLTATAGDLSPARGRQLSLFATAAAEAVALPRVVYDLIAKYGAGHFYQANLEKGWHPLPERRFQLHTVTGP